jgi:hypothetical protein
LWWLRCDISTLCAGDFQLRRSGNIAPIPGWTTQIQRSPAIWVFQGVAYPNAVSVVLLADGTEDSFVDGVYRGKYLPGYISDNGIAAADDASGIAMVPFGPAGNIWASTYSWYEATWVMYQQYGPIKAGTFLEFDYAVVDYNTIVGATSFIVKSTNDMRWDLGDNQQVRLHERMRVLNFNAPRVHVDCYSFIAAAACPGCCARGV